MAADVDRALGNGPAEAVELSGGHHTEVVDLDDTGVGVADDAGAFGGHTDTGRLLGARLHEP